MTCAAIVGGALEPVEGVGGRRVPPRSARGCDRSGSACRPCCVPGGRSPRPRRRAGRGTVSSTRSSTSAPQTVIPSVSAVRALAIFGRRTRRTFVATLWTSVRGRAQAARRGRRGMSTRPIAFFEGRQREFLRWGDVGNRLEVLDVHRAGACRDRRRRFGRRRNPISRRPSWVSAAATTTNQHGSKCHGPHVNTPWGRARLNRLGAVHGAPGWRARPAPVRARRRGRRRRELPLHVQQPESRQHPGAQVVRTVGERSAAAPGGRYCARLSPVICTPKAG